MCHSSLWLLCFIGCGGCGGSPSNSQADADPPHDGPACAPECIESNWWLTVSSDCSVICMGNPSLAECMKSDCQSVQADRYDGTQQRSLAPLLHSTENRSFYLFGSVMTNAYTITAECALEIPMRTPRPFECSAGTLRFTTAIFTAASSEQSVALDTAATMNVLGRYSY